MLQSVHADASFEISNTPYYDFHFSGFNVFCLKHFSDPPVLGVQHKILFFSPNNFNFLMA